MALEAFLAMLMMKMMRNESKSNSRFRNESFLHHIHRQSQMDGPRQASLDNQHLFNALAIIYARKIMKKKIQKTWALTFPALYSASLATWT